MPAKSKIHLVVGEQYGSWTVVEVGLYIEYKSDSRHRKRRAVRVWCACGATRVQALYHLRYGHTRSCGCSKKTGVVGYVQGWTERLRQVRSPRRNVTGRNILKELGRRPSPEHYLILKKDRNDVRLEDIAWCHGRPNTHLDAYWVDGEWISLKYGAGRLGMSWQAIRSRLRAGWSVEEAFLTPKGGQR